MRRPVKITLWTLGAVALLLLLLVGGLLVIGNTEAGRHQIEKLVTRLTAGNVQLTGLAGSFPSHLYLAELQLKDNTGVWLTAKRIQLDWTPLAYLERRLRIDRLKVASVDIERLPQAGSSPNNAQPFIPRIDVVSASIDQVHLGPQLAGAPALLAASGSAHLKSVRDMLFDVSARRIDGEGSYELHLHFDEKRMDASLNLHEPAGGPLENILSLPGLGALQATADLKGLREAEHLEVLLQAGELKGQVQGSFNLKELSADLTFELSAAATAPRPDLSWQRAALRGRWHGDLKTPTAEAHLEVSRLRLPGNSELAGLSADIAAELGMAKLHAIVKGLRIPGQEPGLLEDDPVRIEATMRLDDPTRRLELTASHSLFSLRGEAVTAGHQSATFEARLPNVSPFAALAGQDLHGSALLKAQADGYPAGMRFKLDLNAALNPGTQVWAGAVGDQPRLQLTGQLKKDVLSIDEMKLTGRALVISASGNIAPQTIKARWDVALSDLSTLSSVLAGTLKASGTVDGPKTAMAADARLTASLSIRGSTSGDVSAEMKLKGLPSTTEGTIDAQGILDGAPLRVGILLQRAAGSPLRAVVNQANWKSVHADGDVAITEHSNAHGRLSLSVAQLGDLQHLTGVSMAGSLGATIALQPDVERTRAHLQLDAADLVVAGLAGSVHVSGDGFADSFAFDAGVQIPKLHGAAASLTAKGTLNLDAKQVSLASALGNYRGQDLRLLAPTRVYFANGAAVDVIRIGAQKAELDVQGQFAPSLGIRAALRQVQAPLVNVFFPNVMAAGTIEAHADITGTPSSPQGEVTVNASGIQMADDAALGLPPTNVRITAGLRGHTVDLDARLDAGSASQLTALGQVPIALDGAVALKINGKADVGLINPFLEARGLHAAGELRIDADVEGSVAAPDIGGSLTLAKGSLNDYVRGIALTEIAAQVDGKQGALEITRFTASAAPGTLSMSGTIGVLQKDWPVDLKLTARNAQPIVSKLITANLNADLAVKGKARSRVDIEGSIQLNRTLIGIPNSLPPNVAVLDVVRRGKKTVVVAEKALIVGLDVVVKAPREILVQGRGLDAEMGGELKISGTTSVPLVTGGFDLIRGSFSLASTRLNFTSGRVSFNGAGLKNKIDPTLDFSAQSSIGTTTAIMNISGYADAPVFEFTSTPANLPQDEIMAQLLFGQSLSTLSALQVAQIGYALATLSGVGGNGGFNPLVKIQKSLGLDRLAIGSGPTNAAGENTGASIAAGRYISKRVYIEAKQNTTGTSQLQANVDLTKRLKLQTKLGNGTASVQGTTPENDPGSSIGLLYQFEY
ncbi:MAG: translocation/assembly module TamB domain-containing protein [Pseudomonadota bacterium]|nr:translocation/assembly module TamB domain-containing protein [Pseudomonadota bacterium]